MAALLREHGIATEAHGRKKAKVLHSAEVSQYVGLDDVLSSEQRR